jgi:hypothetical protein
VKRNSDELFPHDIITYLSTTIRGKKIEHTQMTSREATSTESNAMEARQLHSSQKEAMRKLVDFSGESDETDIEEWLYDLTNLFALMKLKDETKILETMGKLTGPALRWYQENLRSFCNWDEAETSLKDRFKEFASDSQVLQEFFQIQQEESQSVTSFYETVIRKYRKAKQFITEQQVITVLQTGVKKALKEHLIRQEKDIKKPEEWLQRAKEEEYVQKRIQQQLNGFYSETMNQAFFEPLLPTAVIQSNPSRNFQQSAQYQHRQEGKQAYGQAFGSREEQRPTGRRDESSGIQRKRPMESCLVCNRTNHPTAKCLYKKENGCFKCGHTTHRVRDCPEHYFFE